MEAKALCFQVFNPHVFTFLKSVRKLETHGRARKHGVFGKPTFEGKRPDAETEAQKTRGFSVFFTVKKNHKKTACILQCKQHVAQGPT